VTSLLNGAAPPSNHALEPLCLVELVAPLPSEISRATDANEDPVFTLRLNRPLTPYERRVVALELPAAWLHDDLSATIGLGLVPSQLANRPQGVLIIVAGISAVASALRAAELETKTKSNLAAEAVNFLLNR
jgi:hypothetical protein